MVEGDRKATAKKEESIVQEQPNLDKRHCGIFFFFFFALPASVQQYIRHTRNVSKHLVVG